MNNVIIILKAVIFIITFNEKSRSEREKDKQEVMVKLFFMRTSNYSIYLTWISYQFKSINQN